VACGAAQRPALRQAVLSAFFGGALLATGQLEGVEARLRAAERWLDPLREPGGSLREPQDTTTDKADRRERPHASSAAMVVVNEEEFRRLPGSIAVWRAGLALVLGDIPNTRKYAQRALDLVPEDDLLGRGGAAGLLGLAACERGSQVSAADVCRWHGGCAGRRRRSGERDFAQIDRDDERLGERLAVRCPREDPVPGGELYARVPNVV